jgi:predicted acyl esterase
MKSVGEEPDSSATEAASRASVWIRCTAVLVAVALALSLSGTRSAIAQPSGSSPYPGGVWQPGPARYGSVVVDDVPITMDDGVVLRASVSYPTDLTTGQRAAGQFPVAVEHTPYVALQAPVVPIAYLTEHGYITVAVRARGAGSSGGDIQYVSPRDGEDGKAIVDWAAHRLDGSDGRVGLIGCSYPGALAMTDAAHVGPNSPLKAVVAACNALVPQNRETFMLSGLMTYNMQDIADRMVPLIGNTPSATRFFTDMQHDIEAGGPTAYDGDFWRDRQPLRLTQNIVDNDIPVLQWSGWHDIAETTVLRTYAAFQNAHDGRPVYAPMTANQPVTPRYQVIVGDWGHASGLDAGIYLQWLDTWVRGVDTGIQHTANPMHLYESGSERWINTARLPAVSDYTPTYLAAEGTLAPKAPGNAGSDALRFGGATAPEGRLTYTTEPLATGTTLSGPIGATIYASSSNTNLVLIARLNDVAPDGTTREVSKGAVLGSQSQLDPDRSWTDPSGAAIWPWPRLDRDDYLSPETTHRFDISLAPRQWGIAPGHRLQLALITQNLPDVCPAEDPTGVPGPDPCGLTAPQQQTLPGGAYEILYGPATPSAVNLPELPWQLLPTAPSAVLPTGWDEGNRQMVTTNPALPLNWG